VKKAFRTFSVLAVSALYFFILSVGGNHAFVESSCAQTPSGSWENSAFVSSKLLCNTVPAERTTVHYNAPPPSLKNSVSELSACLKTTEQLFFRVFSQYRFYSQQVLVRLQNTDLIFPFHSFW